MYKILKNIIEMDDYSVQKLSKSQPPTPFQWNTVEGTELNVDDCIGGKGKIEVRGNTEQQTYEGKNLFNINTIIENTYLDEYDVTGSSSVTNLSDYIEIVAEKTYTLSYKYATLLNSNKRNINFYDVNKDFISGGSYTPAEISHTLTTPNNAKYLRFSYDKNCNNIQLEQSSVVTDYEPYCGGQASPNPSYPQETKKVTGDNKIYLTSNNNKFDFNKPYIPGNCSNGTITRDDTTTINIANKVLTITSKSEWRGYISDVIEIEAKNYCKIQWESSSNYVYVGIIEYDSSKKYIKTTATASVHENAVETITTENTKYIRVVFENKNATTVRYSNIQLIIANKFELNLGNIELCQIGNYKDVLFKNEQSSEYYNSSLIKGAWYKKNAIKKHTFNENTPIIAYGNRCA